MFTTAVLETFRQVNFVDFLPRHFGKAGLGWVGIFKFASSIPSDSSLDLVFDSWVLICTMNPGCKKQER